MTVSESVSVIDVQNAARHYGSGETRVNALDGVSVTIRPGEFTALVGPSGSGKTTLLNLIGGLDTPSDGTVLLTGTPISRMSGNQLSDFRRDHIGFIFQAYNLIPVLTAAENVDYIMLLQGVPETERRRRTLEILKKVGLEGKEDRRPSELSGGQQQRVAVARAIASRPKLILADEPTANLDSSTGQALIDMMRELNEKDGMTFLFSTHDPLIMSHAKRLIHLKDGKIERDEVRR